MNGVVVLPGPTLDDGLSSLLASVDLATPPASFHNTCAVVVCHDGHWRFDHKVHVYRDGIDWLTLPGGAS